MDRVFPIPAAYCMSTPERRDPTIVSNAGCQLPFPLVAFKCGGGGVRISNPFPLSSLQTPLSVLAYSSLLFTVFFLQHSFYRFLSRCFWPVSLVLFFLLSFLSVLFSGPFKDSKSYDYFTLDFECYPHNFLS